MARRLGETDPAGQHDRRHGPPAQAGTTPKPKTSAAAAFALVFGLSAMVCAVALIAAPVAVLFGIIALILGIVGVRKAKQWHVTGKGVAISGIILGVLGLLLGIGVTIGAITFLNDPAFRAQLERVQDTVEQAT